MLFFCYIFCVNKIKVLSLWCQISRFDAAVKHRRIWARGTLVSFASFLLFISKLFNIFVKTKEKKALWMIGTT